MVIPQELPPPVLVPSEKIEMFQSKTVKLTSEQKRKKMLRNKININVGISVEYSKDGNPL